MKADYTDDVRGIIVSTPEADGRAERYEFFAKLPGFAFTVYLNQGYFANDAAAEAWVKEHYPDEYKGGIEMRTRI